MELLLGQIPEALYFALFIIFAKQIKEKRILFTVLMVFEYLLTKYTFQYSVLFHISYIALIYLLLKILYKEKAQITDVFLVFISYLSMILFSILAFPFININYTFACILNRILMFLFLFVFKEKLYRIQKVYKLLWNRDDNKKKPMKSTTFRCINLVVFNTTFYILNILMLYIVYYNSK